MSSVNSVPTGGVISTRDTQTGPASTTAGPHGSNMLNKLDPRIDSDLDNRAQYTPGLTSSGNIHPGVQQTAYNPVSSNDGPHDSWIMNKLDPRVDSTTGIMTSKTTNGTGTGSARAPTDTSGVGIATTTDAYPYSDGEGYHSDYDDGSSTRVRQGSSTGAPGAAITEDARNIYDPRITRYNPATGSGYPAPGSTSDTTDDYSGHIDGSRNADQGAKAGRAGEKRPSRMSRTKSGIHGSGETLRGGFLSTVDRMFGKSEDAEKNDRIAREGEREIRKSRAGG